MDIPRTEYIREFPLRQQYPSIKPANKNRPANKNLSEIKVGTNLYLQSLVSTKVKSSPKNNLNMKVEFQKLRLKSQSGKDLGEFNAQVLPLNNIKSKSLLKQNIFKNFNRSVLLSNLMSQDNSKKLVTLIPVQSMKVKKDDGNVDNKIHKPKTILLKRITTNDQFHKEKQEDANTIVTDNCINNECNKKGKSEYNQIQSILVNNENNLKKKENKYCTVTLFEQIDQLENKNSLDELEYKNSLDELSKSTQILKSRNVIDSTSFLTTIPNKLVSISSDANKIIDKGPDLDNQKSDNGEIINNKKKTLFLLPINNEDNTDVSSKQKLPRFLKKGDDFTFSSTFADILQDEKNNKNISEYKNILDENMETDNIGSLNGYFKKIYDDSLVSTNNCKGNIAVITKASDHENFTSQNINDDLSTNMLDNDLPFPYELSSSWSILNEIVNYIKEKTCKDKVTKAMKTLYNYITKKQSIPLHFSTEFKSLNGAKSQKDILESKNLPLTDENVSDILKIKLKEVYTTNTNENCNQRNNIYNDFPMSLLNEPQKSNEYLEQFTKDICTKNSGANKVQQILSQRSTFHNKIFEQLKKDFETVTKMDETGMLNIHKAVIHNRINDVQRYLMVLKACSIDVDIPTEFEMTSLELAVKHNVSTEIVKLLLEYGANPVSSKQIHESALIIASKKNYILLPELIKHVTSVELLNNVDCMGFAPLHYCAQNGNIKGIASLINMGADVNLRENRFGRTALFFAMENNHPLIAKKLIENGANINIPNFSGQTLPLRD